MKLVHIELQRVQTWLFAAPRLRAMVGANALLGEVLRLELPELAREAGRWSLSAATEVYPASNPNDPLKLHDDPSADARDGILARDGGHFEACFARGAKEFAEAAAVLLRRELPGLRFRITIDGIPQEKSAVHFSMELPVLAPCKWTGRGLASVEISQGDALAPEREAERLGRRGALVGARDGSDAAPRRVERGGGKAQAPRRRSFRLPRDRERAVDGVPPRAARAPA